jgi:hypothetical protein
MQTLIVHSRRPNFFRRDLGGKRALAALILIGGAIVGCLFWPIFAAATIWRALTVGDDGALAPAREMTDVYVYILALAGGLFDRAPRLGRPASSRRAAEPANGGPDAGLLCAGLRRDLDGAYPSRALALLLGQDRPRKKPGKADPPRRPDAIVDVDVCHLSIGRRYCSSPPLYPEA